MSDAISARIESLGDWRGALLAEIRQVLRDADPDIVEDVKWRKPTNPLGVPTWSRGGIICTGETYRDKVKLTFMKGGALQDGQGLFNASLGGTRRAIDFRKADKLDAPALTELIRQAIALNLASSASNARWPARDDA